MYDETNTWDASGDSLRKAARIHVDTSSYSTQHYAFFGGAHDPGAFGITWPGTACFRLAEGM